MKLSVVAGVGRQELVAMVGSVAGLIVNIFISIRTQY